MTERSVTAEGMQRVLFELLTTQTHRNSLSLPFFYLQGYTRHEFRNSGKDAGFDRVASRFRRFFSARDVPVYSCETLDRRLYTILFSPAQMGSSTAEGSIQLMK